MSLILEWKLFIFIDTGGVGGCAGVLQLSEPLLWFVLRVMSSEEALEQFVAMGGIKVRPLVESVL